MQITAENCHAIMCGAISQAEAGREAVYGCAAAGMVGAYGQGSPQCPAAHADAPPPDISVTQVMDGTAPDYMAEPLADQPQAVIDATPITPYNLVAPMPSITNNLPTAPASENPPFGGACVGLAGFVNANPLVSVGIVLGLAYLARK